MIITNGVMKLAQMKSIMWRLSSKLKLKVRPVLLCGVAFVFSASPSLLQAKAKSLNTPVATYNLQCDETFSCPTSILPRVSFWVEVFSRWDNDTAVFHDKENPHRVFATLKRKDGCRNSRKADIISRERKSLKKSLESLASRIDKGKSLSSSQRKLHTLFTGESTGEIRSAANRIRCQSGNKNRMREALSQFRLYRPTILDALESQNLTPELQYLPFVESAFNPKALSHVGAAGLWQIMPATGRTLGLVVDDRIDQRYDPDFATYAAAAYFRNSVNVLSEAAFDKGSTVEAKDLNPFVITSYNYGVRGMERAIAQVGLDYERLLVEYKSPSFQTAVKNFYASFLAARHVAKNADTFFGEIEQGKSKRIHSFNTITLKRSTSVKRLSKSLKVDIDILKKLNPSFKKVLWKHKALIPKGHPVRVSYKEEGWTSELALMDQLPLELERPGFQWHRVTSGQTACGIAERYGASCKAVFKLNKLDRRGTIFIGRRLKVPTKTGGIGVAGSTKVDSSESVSASGVVSQPGTTGRSSTSHYRIRPGDTACLIANKFKMSCSEFLAINGLTRDSVIKSGLNVIVAKGHQWHKVSKGQGACQIAQQYGVGCSALLSANQLTTRSVIQVGQRLRIPL